MRDLAIGAEILKEALDRELLKEERQERAKKQEKAAAAAQVSNVSTSSSVLSHPPCSTQSQIDIGASPGHRS